ncbi:unnamed protein product [Chrysodeixis includens]|uniref:Transmembrane protein 208 n=1 Tax=Chrysodeixis includens TaxID=689277 RepID=A0A9P0C295_CHRIL|nr:unnamed protein product [Chrysodeixis includens]
MAPKRKFKAKGARQILLENAVTVNFYCNIALGATVFNTVIAVVCYKSYGVGQFCVHFLISLIYTACYRITKSISRPTYSKHTQLLDPGIDLNMEGGVGEHIKDIVIMTSITQLLATISNYFWFLLLLLPARALWLLCKSILRAWLFQGAPEHTEQDEKKRKKMERKMKRHQ